MNQINIYIYILCFINESAGYDPWMQGKHQHLMKSRHPLTHYPLQLRMELLSPPHPHFIPHYPSLIPTLSPSYPHLIPSLSPPYPHLVPSISPHYPHLIPTLIRHSCGRSCFFSVASRVAKYS